jgi:hypothetical protein
MVYPPIFQEIHERIGIFVQNTAPADARQFYRQNVVQLMMLFGVWKINPFKKSLLYAEMDTRVIVHHIDDGGKHIFGITVLHYEMQRIDGRDYSPVLFVDDWYAQIVVGLPNYKNIVPQQVRADPAILFLAAHIASYILDFLILNFHV